jgi:hypothetical protein
VRRREAVEQLVTLHLLEDNGRGGLSLYEVQMLVADVHALRDGDRGAWRRAITRARELIIRHRDELA